MTAIVFENHSCLEGSRSFPFHVQKSQPNDGSESVSLHPSSVKRRVKNALRSVVALGSGASPPHQRAPPLSQRLTSAKDCNRIGVSPKTKSCDQTLPLSVSKDLDGSICYWLRAIPLISNHKGGRETQPRKAPKHARSLLRQEQ
ncbi:uncharacterized protein MEPE_06576 [Melanopsichium pennsylvanicum]|uniref:Uncharacterized protein n=1 Tax=Melanopsichium pennsylvanicum TaxID=63383 RepID=A0AAJ4XSR4_9BASI|nr:uncharacterized protein MEPE_06576 [Melanopsichium pennsylvanicum]